MVDPVSPPAPAVKNISAADQQVAGVEAEAHIGARQQFVDLVGCLDVGARMVVEGRLESRRPDTVDGSLDITREPYPSGFVEDVPATAARIGLPMGIPGIGQCRLRSQRRAGGESSREDLERRIAATGVWAR